MKQLISFLLLFYSLTTLAQKEYNAQKLSSYLRKLVKKESVEARGRQKADGTVCTLLKLYHNIPISDVTNRYGCQVLDSIGDIYFMQVPISRLGTMSLDSCISKIECHEVYSPQMNEVPLRIGADSVWQGCVLPQAFTGKGVVAGIADIGFDFTHAMFQKTGGMRVIRFIDMDKRNNDGTYGALYDIEDVLEMKHSPRAINQTHGTHVSSLMAGTPVQGTEGIYSGIAPESDIVLVEVGVNPDNDTNNGSSTSASILLGVKHIFDYADEIGQPCVVNLSMGGWHSILDSVELEKEAISGMTGPGHIFVASAGNYGQYYATLTKKESTPIVTGRFWGDATSGSGSSQSQAKSIKCTLLASDSQNIQFDFFNFGFGLFGGTDVQDSIAFNTDTLDILDGEVFVSKIKVIGAEATVTAYKVVNVSHLSFDNTYQFEVTLDFDTFIGSFSQWIRYCGIEVSISSNNSCIMFTNPDLTPFRISPRRNDDEIDRYETCISNMYTISFPAETENVIAVGAQNTRTSGSHNDLLASFSSQGPTWDNRIKPEVTAPGVSIRGAYNKFCNTFEKDKTNFYDTVYDIYGKEHNLITYDGTSMSSPIVAGTIALWLQAKPDLTALDIRDIFAHSCKQIDDERIDGYPNNMYGYGEIDAYAGLLYILGIPNSIKDISVTQPASARVQLEKGTLIVVDTTTGLPIQRDIGIKIYTIEGKTVAYSNHNTLYISNIPKGLYVVQINAKQLSHTGSTLIRL